MSQPQTQPQPHTSHMAAVRPEEDHDRDGKEAAYGYGIATEAGTGSDEQAQAPGRTQTQAPTAPAPASRAEPPKSSSNGKSKLPDWISNNIKNPASLKMLLRCWLISWVAFILLFPQKSLETLGQAAFFACIVTLIIPANMPVSIWLFANATLVIGACFGWAISCAAMAASLRARNQVLLQQSLQRTQASVAGATNPETEFQVAIFKGDFLDIRSTAVFGVFFVITAYFMGVVQAKNPKLKLFAIFGTIVLDVMCSYGPLFPFAQYTLATIFMLPIGCALGIGFACLIFVFPETLNHAWQNRLVSLLQATKGLLKLHQQLLTTASPDDTSTWNSFEARFKGAQAGIVALMEALHGQAGFLELEVSHGRHSASDLTRIFSTMRVMSVRLFGLSSFHHFMAGREDGVNPMASSGFGSDEDEKMALDKEAERQDMNRSVHVHDTHHLMRLRKLFRAAEVEQQVGLEALVPVMVEAAQDTMDASEKCLDAIAHWFGETNKHRYFQQPTAEQYRAALDALRSAADELAISLDAFTNSNRLRLIEPYVRHFRSISPDGAHHLDAEGARAFRLGARPLFYCMVFCANLQNFAASVEKTTREVHALAEKRPSNKVWWPTGLRKLGKVLSNRKTNVGGALDFGQADGERELSGRNDSFVQDETEEGDGGEDGAETATANESHSKAGISADDDSHKAREKEKVRRRRVAAMDPDALGPTHWFHHFGRFLAAAYHFVWSPEGVFALKYAIVSFALWVPAVVPHSAYFNYQHRGLWALIMAQTGMATYAGEQLFSLAGRLIGTLAGCVVGMLVWYIGDAKSNGNAYGLAATMAVFFVPIVFLRLFAPPALLMPVIMLSVTTALVTGYSWIDSHLPVLANSGIGYEIAWRRALLVIIGMTASFIVMIFPKPTSSRALVRRTLARTTVDIHRMYALIVEGWIIVDSSLGAGTEKVLRKSDSHEDRKTEKALQAFRTRFLETQATLRGVNTQIAMASLDFQVRGPWPKARYEQMLSTQMRMIESLAQLAGALSTLQTTWRRKFVRYSAILNPNTIADISATFALLAQSLKTGTPLPHAAGNLLLERTVRNQSLALRIEDELHHRTGGDADQISLAVLKDTQYQSHVAGVMALLALVTNIDEFGEIVRSLVGEVPLPGYDQLRDTWDDRQMAAFGRS